MLAFQQPGRRGSQDWAGLGLGNQTPSWEQTPVGSLAAQNIVPKGAEPIQAWFKHGHIPVCLVCLARHRKQQQDFQGLHLLTGGP